MTTEKPCSDHPDAPHGFVRNASHSVGHYVCECSGWTPPEPKSLQERLRNSVGEDDLQVCMDEAADRIDLDASHIATLAKVVDKLQTERDVLRANNKELLDQRFALMDQVAALQEKLDQYRTEYFQTLRERDELAADKEVLLGHMATLRNITKEPQVSLLTRLVLERMAPGGMK